MATPIPFPADGVILTNTEYTYAPTNVWVSILPMAHPFERVTVTQILATLVDGFIGGTVSYIPVQQNQPMIILVTSPLERSLKVTLTSIDSGGLPDFNNETTLGTVVPTAPIDFYTFPTPGFYVGDFSNVFTNGDVIQVAVEGSGGNDKLIDKYRATILWGAGVPGLNTKTTTTIAEVEQGSPEIFVVQDVTQLCWRVINERGGPTIMRFQKIAAPTA